MSSEGSGDVRLIDLYNDEEIKVVGIGPESPFNEDELPQIDMVIESDDSDSILDSSENEQDDEYGIGAFNKGQASLHVTSQTVKIFSFLRRLKDKRAMVAVLNGITGLLESMQPLDVTGTNKKLRDNFDIIKNITEDDFMGKELCFNKWWNDIASEPKYTIYLDEIIRILSA